MKFSINWVSDRRIKAPEERATLADIKINLNKDSVATSYIFGDEKFDSLIMPTYSLAEGLALEWWQLFANRNYEFHFKRYRDGYAVPDLRMTSDGTFSSICSKQIQYENPPIKFDACSSINLRQDEVSNIISNFITETIEKLKLENVDRTTLALQWERVCRSLEDKDEKLFCEAAGALGYDPYCIDDAIASVIEKSADIFNEEMLIDFLSGVHPNKANETLEWIVSARKKPAYQARLDDLEDIIKDPIFTDQPRTYEGWDFGYRRAREFRRVLDLKESEYTSINSCRKLAKKLGNRNFRPRGPVNGVRAIRDYDDRGNIMFYLRGHTGPAEQLFSLARGIGDAACFPTKETSSVNDVKHSYRQRCNRAFAAELLAPSQEVQVMYQDGKDLPSIAHEFGVSESVINHQLENTKRIKQTHAA